MRSLAWMAVWAPKTMALLAGKRGLMTLRCREVDVVVIGGGHAGCEAAAAAARTGAVTALLTQRVETIGEMSCNPSIGGIGKGHLVREVDALGGLMGRAIDEGSIHFRMLNRRKGPAVWGPRAQADRDLYKAAVGRLVEGVEGLSVVEGSAEDVEFDDGKVTGVVAKDASGEFVIKCKAAVVTTGTFLRGRCYVGRESYAAGRHERNSDTVEPPANALASTLEDTLGLPLGRLKTGTPPRLDGRTIDWSKCEVQASEDFSAFSYANPLVLERDRVISCYRTNTNERTHDIVRSEAHTLAPPSVTGTGPRYCPSIYKKVERFGERSAHGVWLEPEGLDTHIVYPNGLSGAFPLDVQRRIVHSIEGLESAEIVQAGYDVEYDFVDPRSLDHTLRVTKTDGLYLAGQICGTTGYEEAAALGIVAGANAGLFALSKPRFVVSRRDAYIGVLVDDLVSRGTQEPYRVFTSRAEYRLHLRADNADLRLTRAGYDAGLVPQDRMQRCVERLAAVDDSMAALTSTRYPAADWYKHLDFAPDEQSWGKKATAGLYKTAAEVLAMPHATIDAIERAANDHLGGSVSVPLHARDTVSALCKYSSYLERQQNEFDVYKRNEHLFIPPDLDYSALPALSAEEREKFVHHRPKTFADASAISGITPASLVYLYNHISQSGRASRRRAATSRSEAPASSPIMSSSASTN